MSKIFAVEKVDSTKSNSKALFVKRNVDNVSLAFNRIKKEALIRSYWGRGNSYKKFLHIFILITTILVFISGISLRLSEFSRANVILADTGINANVDTLQQGVGIQTTETKSSNFNFKITNHTVADGDTLDSIASTYAVSADTIQWANQSKVNYFDKKVNPGDVLVIPEITGVLYEVASGDNLDTILSKTEGNRFEVIEINQLSGPGFDVVAGSKILVPNGKLPPPAPPPPVIPIQTYYQPTNVGVNIYTDLNYASLNSIAFVNPLSNPSCGGYTESRGYWGLYSHNGTDLAKGGGCPIRAAAAGEVVFAGWSDWGEGYNVRIYHGNGVQTSYYHGSEIWVQVGQSVAAGQEIMYMGCTGNCTGTHLHFGLKLDNVFIDPRPYVPY